jgi:hypothetical protein
MPVYNVPFSFRPTLALREALATREAEAATAAFREVALAARGFDLAYLQFAFRDLTLAVCSRIRLDGRVEVEADLGSAGQPRSTFTEAEYRKALNEAATRARLQRGEAGRRRR